VPVMYLLVAKLKERVFRIKVKPAAPLAEHPVALN